MIRQSASHPISWGPAATGRMTAVSAVAGAEALGGGGVRAMGVLPPEAAFEPEAFVRAVRRAGVRVTLREAA